MVLPKPKKGETRKAFMARFMSDPTVKKEYPKHKQRMAVGFTQFSQKDNSPKPPVEGGNPFRGPSGFDAPGVVHLSGDLVYEPGDLEASEDGGSRKLPTFKMKANTGVPVKVRNYYDQIVIDMKGVKLSNKILPVVADHVLDRTSRVGHTTSISVNTDSIDVEGVVSATGDTAQEIVKDAANGFPFQASLGARVKDALYIPEKQSVKANGRIYKGPVILARKTEIYEFTVTSLGADTNTSFNIKAGSPNGGTFNQSDTVGVITMGFEEFVISLGFDPKNLTDELKTTLKASYDNGARVVTEVEDEGGGGDNQQQNVQMSDLPTPEEYRQSLLDQQEYVSSMSDIIANYDGEVDNLSDIRAKAFKENWTPEKLELHLMRESRPQVGRIAIHKAPEGAPEAKVIEASMLLSIGDFKDDEVGKMIKDDKVMELAMSQRYRGYSIIRLCHEAINAAGMYAEPGRKDNEFIRTVMKADRTLRAHADVHAASPGQFSTVNVQGILGNVMNKSMLQVFSHGDQTLQSISSSRSVSDFKTIYSFRMTGIGEFLEIGPGGEIKQLSIGQEGYENRARTYGAMINLTRNDIVNDDLSAFLNVPRIIGRAAAMKLRDVGWATFLDDSAFFNQANGNVLSNTPYSIEGLSSAVEIFRRQTDINGKLVDIIPEVQLGPVGIAVEMQKVFTETRLIVEVADSASSTNIVKPDMNPHVGKYRPMDTAWLEPEFTSGGGGSLVDWYLLSSNPDTAVLELCYLNGVQTPIIEEVDVAPDVLGMSWRSYFDFGAALKEHRGGVKVYAESTAPLNADDAQERMSKVRSKRPRKNDK